MAASADAALPGFHEGSEPMGMTISLTTSAEAARGQGDLRGAMAGFAQAEALCREIGFTWGQAASLVLGGEVARDHSDAATACRMFARSLDIY